MSRWTVSDIPDLSGKIAVVTGANSGLGLETARALAGCGAHVVMACRNMDKGAKAVDNIKADHPDANLELSELDLASLESIKAFAERFYASHEQLHILCNNAGIMAIPYRKTEDGFEMQIGTNHFGHYALTGRLLKALLAADTARIVNVSSTAHRIGKMRFDDIHSERSYSKWPAYGQSKLANLLFTYELQRRLDDANRSVIAAASHPGYSATNLQFVGAQMEKSSFWASAFGASNRLFSQDAAMGALPSLYAATALGVQGGDYYGPGGFMEVQGYPKRVSSNARSHDRDAQRRLWEISEELTGVTFEM